MFQVLSRLVTRSTVHGKTPTSSEQTEKNAISGKSATISFASLRGALKEIGNSVNVWLKGEIPKSDNQQRRVIKENTANLNNEKITIQHQSQSSLPTEKGKHKKVSANRTKAPITSHPKQTEIPIIDFKGELSKFNLPPKKEEH